MTGAASRLAADVADRYRLERELGRGGMATVWLAEDLRHRRAVAIKVLDPRLAEALGAERFLREIAIVARLSHPHILPLFDSGEAGGTLYYVMPHIEGESLRARLRREGRLPVDEAVRLTCEAAEALEYAHGEGVIHRDIKPDNILFSRGHALVADFGIARAVKLAGGDPLTATGLSIGTPAYMSPEQALGEKEIGPASDVYSLGCVLFELLAGEPPFAGATAEAALVKRFTEAAPSVRTRRGDVPGPVAAALARALAKDVTDRIGSAGALALALGPAHSASPVADSRLHDRAGIVVLPFDSMSPDVSDAYLADGLTEELISDLSRVRTLRVISRNSAIAVKSRTRDVREVARLVDVRYVLEGSVRRSGNDLRITAQLIDGWTDAHLWTEKYNGTMDDVFTMQERLSRAIVDALRIRLTAAERQAVGTRPVQDARAYDVFLRARQEIWHLDPASLGRARDLILEAIAAGGEHAELLATLAYVDWITLIGTATGTARTLRELGASADRALELDPESAAAHFAKGAFASVIGDWEAVLDHLGRAAATTSSSDAIALYATRLVAVGEVVEAREWADRAVAMDPLGFPVLGWACGCAAYTGDDRRATELAERVGRIAPETWSALWTMWICHAAAGRLEEALRCARKMMRLDNVNLNQREFARRWAAALAGQAIPVVTLEESTGLATDLLHSLMTAESLSCAGHKADALIWLRNAVSRGFLNTRYMSEVSPFLAPLHTEPAFQILMAEAEARRNEWQKSRAAPQSR